MMGTYSGLYVFGGRGHFFFFAYIYLRAQLERDPESDRLGHTPPPHPISKIYEHYAHIPGWISTRTGNLQFDSIL